MKLNIFGKEYLVKIQSISTQEIGICNHLTNEIFIDDSKITNDSLEQVIIHEVIHALVDRIGFRQFLESQAEEILCESLSRCLVENFKFNLDLGNRQD